MREGPVCAAQSCRPDHRGCRFQQATADVQAGEGGDRPDAGHAAQRSAGHAQSARLLAAASSRAERSQSELPRDSAGRRRCERTEQCE